MPKGKPGLVLLVARGILLILLVVGVTIATFGVHAARSHAEAVRELPPVTAVNLATISPGTKVLVEGRIAEDAPRRYREFVAGTRWAFRDWTEDEPGRRQSRWDRLELFRPPLPIVTEEGVIRVLNEDYEIYEEPHAWQSSEKPVWVQGGERTERVTGFLAGDVVCAEGTVQTVDGVSGVHVVSLVGHSRDEYAASLEMGAGTLRVVGMVLGVVGGAGLSGSLLWMSYRGRTARARHAT